MASYRNPWHNPQTKDYGPEFYEADARPEEYRGHLIYHRNASVWDVVRDGVCITQRAGPNGARQAIDSIFEKSASRSDTNSRGG